MNQTIKQTNQTEQARNIYLVGTQTGQCPLCKETKKVLLLRFSLTLCPACLDICMKILEDLELVTTKDTNLQNNAPKNADTAKRIKSSKKPTQGKHK